MGLGIGIVEINLLYVDILYNRLKLIIKNNKYINFP